MKKKYALIPVALLLSTSLLHATPTASETYYYCPAAISLNGGHVIPQSGPNTLNQFQPPVIMSIGNSAAGIINIPLSGAAVETNLSGIQTYCYYQNPKTGADVTLQNDLPLLEPSSLTGTCWKDINNNPNDPPLYGCDLSATSACANGGPSLCPFVLHQ